MAKTVPVGTRASAEQTVEFKHTLTAFSDQLPPVYSTPDMIRLMETAAFYALQPYCEGDEITVDLKSRTVDAFPFELDDFSRTCLLEGLDDIALTLREADAIAAYEASHPVPLTTIASLPSIELRVGVSIVIEGAPVTRRSVIDA